MSGQENLYGIVKELDEIHTRLREEEGAIDSTLTSVANAIDLYRKFKLAYGSNTFDVHVVKVSNEKITEVPFDWKSLG